MRYKFRRLDTLLDTFASAKQLLFCSQDVCDCKKHQSTDIRRVPASICRSCRIQEWTTKCWWASFKLARELGSPREQGRSSLCVSLSLILSQLSLSSILPAFLHSSILWKTQHNCSSPTYTMTTKLQHPPTTGNPHWNSSGMRELAWGTGVISERVIGSSWVRCVLTPGPISCGLRHPHHHHHPALEVTLSHIILCSFQRAVGGKGAKLPGWMLSHKERNYL